MNRLFLILIMLLAFNTSTVYAYKHSTHHQAGIFLGYNYLHAPEWNRIIGAYNFSRPYNNEKIPYLNHGFTAGVYYSMPVHLGINLNPEFLISRFGTNAENFGQKLSILSTQYSAVANVRMYPFNLKKHHGHHIKDNIFVDLAPSFTWFRTGVRQNGDKVLLSSGEEFASNIFSVDIRVGIGYDIHLSKTLTFTPNARVNWYPGVEVKNLSEAINGSNVPALSNKTALFNLQIGGNVGYNF